MPCGPCAVHVPLQCMQLRCNACSCAAGNDEEALEHERVEFSVQLSKKLLASVQALLDAAVQQRGCRVTLKRVQCATVATPPLSPLMGGARFAGAGVGWPWDAGERTAQAVGEGAQDGGAPEDVEMLCEEDLWELDTRQGGCCADALKSAPPDHALVVAAHAHAQLSDTTAWQTAASDVEDSARSTRMEGMRADGGGGIPSHKRDMAHGSGSDEGPLHKMPEVQRGLGVHELPINGESGLDACDLEPGFLGLQEPPLALLTSPVDTVAARAHEAVQMRVTVVLSDHELRLGHLWSADDKGVQEVSEQAVQEDLQSLSRLVTEQLQLPTPNTDPYQFECASTARMHACMPFMHACDDGLRVQAAAGGAGGPGARAAGAAARRSRSVAGGGGSVVQGHPGGSRAAQRTWGAPAAARGRVADVCGRLFGVPPALHACRRACTACMRHGPPMPGALRLLHGGCA
jgi:hypothetical protein